MAAETPLPPKFPGAADGADPTKAPEEKSSVGTSAPPEVPRVEVSAAAVTRMMGIATVNDLRLLEGRVDVLTSKVAALLTKIERLFTTVGSLPTSSDIDRLGIDIGVVKSLLRDLAEAQVADRGAEAEKTAASEQGKKLRDGIKSN